MTRFSFYILLIITITGCRTSHTSNHKEVTILPLGNGYIFGDDRPFPQCHASTVVETQAHDYVVAWFGGTHEKHDDVGIWLSKGTPGHWSAPVEIAKLREEPHWNPVLHKTSSGKLMLYFKVGRSIDYWETWYMTSADDGTTWSAAQELVPGDQGGRGPVKNKLIVLSDGTWLAPASDEKKGVWNAYTDRSEDQGQHWIASAPLSINRDSIPGEGIIQPTLWESKPGQVHMLLRSSSGYICRSDSKDYGKTWSPVYKTSLPNPNSGIDLAQLTDGTLVLVYNRDNKNWGERRPIALAISRDNGKSWPVQYDIEVGVKGDEFSYPAIIASGDTVTVTYTWKRQRIAYWQGKISLHRSR